MAIKTIEKLKTTDLGASNELACPVCGAVSQMRLFENTDGSMVAHLHKKPAQGLAVCPRCATVFTVNPHYIAEKKNGTVCELEPQDLTVLVRGS
ncbi:MAG: hypothetical protein IKH12_03275 [Clostridia bacterium]|nr:hypothetical protein [Clostridia bacterium]